MTLAGMDGRNKGGGFGGARNDLHKPPLLINNLLLLTLLLLLLGHGALFCRGLSRVSSLKNTGRRGTRNFKGLKMARGTTSFWTNFLQGLGLGRLGLLFFLKWRLQAFKGTHPSCLLGPSLVYGIQEPRPSLHIQKVPFRGI